MEYLEKTVLKEEISQGMNACFSFEYVLSSENASVQ